MSVSGKSFSDYFRENRRAVIFVCALAAIILALSVIPFEKSEGVSADDEEERLLEVVGRVFGVGDCEVMISYGEGGEVVGVIILCEGAESAAVRHRLSDLVGSLYGIGANRISILKIE